MGRYDVLLEHDQEAPPAHQVQQKPAPPASEPVPQRPVRPFGRAGERPNAKRIITRNSFEIYEDQMESLRRRAYQEKMAGKVGSMSAMVRDAIDTYLRKNASDQ